MSDIIDIQQLRQEFLDKAQRTKDLKVFAEKQQDLLEATLQKNKDLNEKLKHLEDLLKFGNSRLMINEIIKPEEAICLKQISILNEKSQERELTLEEAKKLEIYVKTLKSLQQETPKNDENELRDVSEADLVAIAEHK